MLDTETICSVGSRSDDDSGPPSLQNELEMEIKGAEVSTETDKLQKINQATSPQSDISPSVPNPPSCKSVRFNTTPNSNHFFFSPFLPVECCLNTDLPNILT